MTKENFKRTIELGDIVTIIGIDTLETCVVMTKTEYACNLFTVEQSNKVDGIMRPVASYYRTYDEIIAKVGSDKILYEYYIELSDKTPI